MAGGKFLLLHKNWDPQVKGCRALWADGSSGTGAACGRRRESCQLRQELGTDNGRAISRQTGLGVGRQGWWGSGSAGTP